jgi:hypothetical protein
MIRGPSALALIMQHSRIGKYTPQITKWLRTEPALILCAVRWQRPLFRWQSDRVK